MGNETTTVSLHVNDLRVLDHLRPFALSGPRKGRAGQARVRMAVVRRQRTGHDGGAEDAPALAELFRTEQLELEAERLHVANVPLEHRGLRFGVANAQMAVRHELKILADELLHPTPDRSRAIGERYLGEVPPLAAHVAEVGAAGLSAHQFAFQQRDRTAM